MLGVISGRACSRELFQSTLSALSSDSPRISALAAFNGAQRQTEPIPSLAVLLGLRLIFAINIAALGL
jgi:hypothetical protein